MFLRLCWFSLVLAVVANCSAAESPLFTPSGTLPAYDQDSFDAYVRDNTKWILENRVFLTENPELEVEMNRPFEKRPENPEPPEKGILLVHGLADSPGYFQDVASDLSRRGYLVRAVLLTGHGSRPADLIKVGFKDWTALIRHHVALLKEEVDEVWLGGFSTGANLVTSYALENERNVEGLLLFSPGFVSDEMDALFWAPLASIFMTWVDQDEPDGNILRYGSLAMNGASLYFRSLEQVQGLLEEKTFDKPVLVTISQDDSVIEAGAIPPLFTRAFTHPQSRLIWFGEPYRSEDPRILSLPSYLPDQRIGSFSHLCVLFSPDHPYYGKDGSYRIYQNGQDREFDGKNDELWFSAWGLKQESKYFARLTWNPHYAETLSIANRVLLAK